MYKKKILFFIIIDVFISIENILQDYTYLYVKNMQKNNKS